VAINRQLFDKVATKLGLGRSAMYRRISDTQNALHISQDAALLKLATEARIGVSRYSDPELLHELRGVQRQPAPATPAPAAVAARSGSRVRSAPAKPVKKTRDNSIWVVHGRDLKLRDDMFSFLRAIDLNPIEWEEAIRATKGSANPIIGDVIDGAMHRAQGILVLFSPDENAKLKPKFATDKDKRDRLTTLEGQPRPNVILEAGMALGAHSDKTILVQVGEIRDISDIAGKHMVILTDTMSSRKTLAQRLRDKLKLKVNLDGNDWTKVGKFGR
jgi:predicted nucleotide-binding protein